MRPQKCHNYYSRDSLFCSKRCEYCWRSRLKDSNNKKSKNFEIIYPISVEYEDDIYSLFIEDRMEPYKMVEICDGHDEQLKQQYCVKDMKDMHHIIYNTFMAWLLLKGINTSKYSKKLVIKNIKSWFDNGAMKYIIMPSIYVTHEGIRELEKDKKDICYVCLGDSNVISNCNHFFCKSCIQGIKILGSNFNCPCCRNENFKLYTICSN